MGVERKQILHLKTLSAQIWCKKIQRIRNQLDFININYRI